MVDYTCCQDCEGVSKAVQNSRWCCCQTILRRRNAGWKSRNATNWNQWRRCDRCPLQPRLMAQVQKARIFYANHTCIHIRTDPVQTWRSFHGQSRIRLCKSSHHKAGILRVLLLGINEETLGLHYRCSPRTLILGSVIHIIVSRMKTLHNNGWEAVCVRTKGCHSKK